jgi:hypothetical protein
MLLLSYTMKMEAADSFKKLETFKKTVILICQVFNFFLFCFVIPLILYLFNLTFLEQTKTFNVQRSTITAFLEKFKELLTQPYLACM